ncbi:unnamed protein product, partial [Gongylonema pulchrum]|uniref:DUF155 domain-containing protein n=1 Tax=Gongylonema pulchrum TaxID=637853 RepID=A0A183E4I5_9BILA
FFVFADGVVVFWGINHIEVTSIQLLNIKFRSQILGILSEYTELPYAASLVLEETDTLSFRMVKEGETRMKGEQLLLNFTDYLDGHFSSLATLERFAFSHGMAASGKHSINLNTNLIDSDFYWEKQDLEPMLNAQLDYCSEILKVVNDMQTHNLVSFLFFLLF